MDRIVGVDWGGKDCRYGVVGFVERFGQDCRLGMVGRGTSVCTGMGLV
jgi:hypothetical protein